MNSVFSLDFAFKPIRQPIIGMKGAKIVYANPAALSAFGEELCERAADQVFPAELLENPAKNFMSSAPVCEKKTRTFVSRQDDLTLFYIDPDDEPRVGLYFTRHMLSHMRNCLNGIKIAADRCFLTLEDNAIPDDRVVAILYHYYYRLARTVIQLDSADKLEHSEMPFLPATANLVSLCSELTDTLTNLHRDKDIKIIFSAEMNQLLATVDSSLLELMLLNLFSNSLKNAESGTVIEFGLKRSHDKIVISLDDNGHGIPQDKLSEIFSLPHDADAEIRAEDGMGLGLYISHEIIQLHKGVLLIESREDEGVHIRILIPVGEETEGAFNAPEAKYRSGGMSTILTGLADVLSSNCYGPRFED